MSDLPDRNEREAGSPPDERQVRLFLSGDVMTGRGIDQILPHSCDPQLFEPHVRSARDYVALAERATGPVTRHADSAYPWGDALAVLEEIRPHARIINLETAVTTSAARWRGKSVHYRMHPDNVRCITSAKIDCCVLANNHVLDWGYAGLDETLAALRQAGIRTAGAGHDRAQAAAPAILELPGARRVLVYAYGSASSGVPASWAAGTRRGGVNFLRSISKRSADAIIRHTVTERRKGDLVVVSLHWGANWGFEVAGNERDFAHRLIDAGTVDVVHGHSSHHIKGIEVYREKLILYGCGDLLNDYEGIRGEDYWRPDLALMYFPLFDAQSNALLQMLAVPVQVRHLRLNRAPGEGATWLHETLARESGKFGVDVVREAADGLSIRW